MQIAVTMSRHTKDASNFERGTFYLFLALISVLLVAIIWPFAAPVLWSALAAIMFQPLYLRILSNLPRHPNRAALATLLIIFIAIIVPAMLIGTVVFEQVTNLYISLRDGKIDAAALFARMYDALPAQQRVMLDRLGLGEFSVVQDRIGQFIKESAGVMARHAFAIGGSAFGLFLGLGVGLYVTYFLVRDGQRLGSAICHALPLEKTAAEQLCDRFVVIVRATIKGSVVVGMVQGALGAVTFWIVGMPSAILFGVLMALFSLLPALGPAIIWIPVAMYLLATGAVWQAIVVVLSGVLVIGLADNILRPILVGRDTGISDWIVLLTTLGGIATIGLSGIVLGPLAAGLFLTAWAMYQEQRDQIDEIAALS